LNNSIAPRLIRILYVVMLVLVTIGVIAGVARGIATIARAPVRTFVARVAVPPPAAAPAANASAAPNAPAPAAQAAPDDPPAPAAPAAAPAQPSAPQAVQPPRGPRFGMGRGFRGGRQFAGPGPRGPAMMRAAGNGRNALLIGTLQIIRTLVMGFIAVMVIRIL